MGREHSILVRELCRRANESYAASGFSQEPDLDELVLSIIKDPAVVPKDVKTKAAEDVERIATDRSRQCHILATEISNMHGGLLDQLDLCVSFADYLNKRLVRAVFKHGKSLRSKNPRPRAGYVTGAMLKSILLLALHAKVCTMSAEISCLLKNGFSDGAFSRVRSVYEHLVVISLIAVDDTYVVSERYQDYACFEELSRLRALKESFEDPATRSRHDRTKESELDAAISELETAAREARALWGRNISQANDWARPALSPAKQRKAKIDFTDLEEAVFMRPYRWIYLGGNQRIHAGAFSTINHMNFESRDISNLHSTQGRRDNDGLATTGWWTVTFIDRATYLVARSVAAEIDEIDELLYLCEMESLIEGTLEKFLSA